MNFIYTNLKSNQSVAKMVRHAIFSLTIIILYSTFGFGQTIFNETIDVNVNTAGTLTIANTVFDNASLSYTGTADTRTTSASTGYTGASGGRNVFLTNNGTANFQIQNINTTGYTNLMLSFGALKTTTASNLTELVLEYSTDGISYTAISFPAQPTGSGTTIWRLIGPISLPVATEGAGNLRLRWRNSSLTPQFRIDDITLTGTIVTAGPCTLQIVSINESECIPVQNDTFPNGYFLYDVEVIYSGGIPAGGSLILSGGEGASVSVGSLSGGSYIFEDIRGTSGNIPFNVTAFFSDNSGCLSVGLVEPPEGCSIPEGSCEELFFSEYLEGSSGNNKCVEIYNPTAVSVDLAAGGYKVLLFANGAVVPGSTINLTGTVPPFGTHLLCNSGSIQTILDLADQTSGSLTHNGDDALVLVKGVQNDTLDIFGSIGHDPGTAWVAGPVTTLDRVLRRKSSVLSGVTSNPNTSGAGGFLTLSSEWDVYADTTYSNFGIHESACTPPIPECPIVEVYVYPEDYNFELCGETFPEGISCYTCNDNGTPDPSDDFFEYYVEVSYNDKPEGGFLIISANGVDIDSFDVGELLFPEGVEFIIFGPYSLPANGLNFTVEARFDEIILCSLASTELAPGPCSALPPCEELFFSEYIEGTGNNKCLEIFNPTDASVDLAANNYQIRMYFNGSAAPGTTVNLTGSIPANGTYVVCSSSAAIEFRNLADLLNGQSWFNGDDAVALSKAGVNIDIIGQIGTDPGASWSGSGVSTVDQTIRRKSFITAGDPNGTDTFNPSIEWDSFPVNELSGLKFHRSDCNQFPDGLVITPIGGCDGDVNQTEAGYDITSSCWGNMIGREATFLTSDVCGDFDFSAKVTVTPFGFAGLMFRESLAPDTRYVYQFVRGNNQASWAVRSNPALPVQVQTVAQINRQFLRMQRVGNLFRGYLSVNGILWNQVHQSGLNFASCGYVGFATHSGSDGIEVSSSYTNINASFIGSPGRPEFANNPDIDMSVKSQDFKVYPNPANQYLDIQLSGSEWTEREISIIDINGRVAFYQKSETSNILKIDLQSAGLTDGVYIIQIKDAEGFYQTRFVKATH